MKGKFTMSKTFSLQLLAEQKLNCLFRVFGILSRSMPDEMSEERDRSVGNMYMAIPMGKYAVIEPLSRATSYNGRRLLVRSYNCGRGGRPVPAYDRSKSHGSTTTITGGCYSSPITSSGCIRQDH